MVFEFGWNNFLHFQVTNMISFILSDENNNEANLNDQSPNNQELVSSASDASNDTNQIVL